MSYLKKSAINALPTGWVTGQLELAGVLDRRMIDLLTAIERTGSLNQAAKEVGLSYKGAWQIIERANNSAPKALINTATGGSRGGGTALTVAGQALVALFMALEAEHDAFLAQLNRRLAANPETLILLQRLAVKISARNQLFGCVTDVRHGAVNAELTITLAGGEALIATVDLPSLRDLNLAVGDDTLVLINDADIVLAIDEARHYAVQNRLACRIVRVQHGDINSDIVVSLAGGELLTIVVTRQSAENMALEEGMSCWVIFNSSAPIVGVAT